MRAQPFLERSIPALTLRSRSTSVLSESKPEFSLQKVSSVLPSVNNYYRRIQLQEQNSVKSSKSTLRESPIILRMQPKPINICEALEATFTQLLRNQQKEFGQFERYFQNTVFDFLNQTGVVFTSLFEDEQFQKSVLQISASYLTEFVFWERKQFSKRTERIQGVINYLQQAVQTKGDFNIIYKFVVKTLQQLKMEYLSAQIQPVNKNAILNQIDVMQKQFIVQVCSVNDKLKALNKHTALFQEIIQHENEFQAEITGLDVFEIQNHRIERETTRMSELQQMKDTLEGK
ncbi:Hypothetical_protein [Hexamita inflata]|uniref:Hypothetical_protein n=1 Tax=Hexamita inflata TaxID=28002 RepID=A0ABP1HZC5_9EUKA